MMHAAELTSGNNSRFPGGNPAIAAPRTPPQPSPLTVPCSMIGVWNYRAEVWAADLGITWFDARQRTIEIIYRPFGQSGSFQYHGSHLSARDRWMKCLYDLPYTDLFFDMVALAEQILPYFAPVTAVDLPPGGRLWQQGTVLELQWELWLTRDGADYPLSRHGWYFHILPDGLAKSWKAT